MTTQVHVTAVRNGSVYGHSTDHCDAAGCNGRELHWPELDAADCAAGHVADIGEAIAAKIRRWDRVAASVLCELLNDLRDLCNDHGLSFGDYIDGADLPSYDMPLADTCGKWAMDEQGRVVISDGNGAFELAHIEDLCAAESPVEVSATDADGHVWTLEHSGGAPILTRDGCHGNADHGEWYRGIDLDGEGQLIDTACECPVLDQLEAALRVKLSCLTASVVR